MIKEAKSNSHEITPSNHTLLYIDILDGLPKYLTFARGKISRTVEFPEKWPIIKFSGADKSRISFIFSLVSRNGSRTPLGNAVPGWLDFNVKSLSYPNLQQPASRGWLFRQSPKVFTIIRTISNSSRSTIADEKQEWFRSLGLAYPRLRFYVKSHIFQACSVLSWVLPHDWNVPDKNWLSPWNIESIFVASGFNSRCNLLCKN